MADMWSLWIGAASAAPVDAWLDAVALVTQGSATCAAVHLGEGRFATAYHCVAPGGRPRVRLRDGRSSVGQVRGVDRANDLAWISAPSLADGPALPLGDAPQVGAEVWALGHPYGEDRPEGLYSGTLRWSAQAGVVSAVGPWALQISAPLNPGSSGGPVVADGSVVGIVSRKLSGQSLGFAGRSEALSELLGAPERRLSPLGGTVALELVLAGQTGSGSTLAGGARLQIAVRDRLLLSGAGLVPASPRWSAARFGAASSVVGEGAAGVRQRFGRGTWSVALDGFVGAAAIHRWEAAPDDPLDLSTGTTVAAIFGGTVRFRAVGFELATSPAGGIGRAGLIWSFPGVLGVF
jgi:hypothetical protein